MELRLVEARAVPEHAGMLAETFPVVRGDDQPGPVEDVTAVELVDQPAELLVEIRDAVVVGGANEGILAHGEPPLVDSTPVFDEIHLALGAWTRPEPVDAPLRKLVRIVGIIVIQEGEKWPLRLPPPGQPVEEFMADRRARFAIPGVELREQPLERKRPSVASSCNRGSSESLPVFD